MKKIIQWFFCALLAFPILSSAQDEPLRAGDKFVLKISGVPADDINQVSSKYTISSKGTIKMPYLRESKVAGLRPSSLARKLEKTYVAAQIYTNPTITINVDEVELKQLKVVSVSGEVRTPGSVSFRTGLTLIAAISDRGGFTDFARTKAVRLIRGNKATSHDVRRITEDPTKDVTLKPGDRIIVTQRGTFR